MALIAFTSDKALANDIYITQSGNGLDLNITQDGENNSIGTSSTRATLNGANTDITIVQETDGASIGLSVDGNDTTMLVKQKCHNGSLCNSDDLRLSQRSQNNTSDHNMDVNIYSDGNDVHVMQEANQDKTLNLTINNDDNNVFIHQKKSNPHTATITLSGSYGTDLSLTQSSTSSAQSYSLTQNCQTIGGCSVSATQN